MAQEISDNDGDNENTDYINSVVSVLEGTVKKFNDAYEQAYRHLHYERDGEKYREKVKQRALLLVELPELIQDVLQCIHDDGIREEILYKVTFFAREAREYLENNNTFGLASLLTHQGSKIGDKNDLELLIEKLKNIKFSKE